VGLEVHRAARVAAAAHGGQLLLTAAARELVRDLVPTEPLGSHRLKDFPAAEQLFCAVVDGRGAGAFQPPRTEEVRPTNLPAGTPVLIGRDNDVARVRDALLLDGERVVTLTGRGGTGKTSLALVVAAGLLDEYPGGVWVTRLANVDAPEDVIPAVASAVGAAGDVESSFHQAIINRLRARGPTLLLLDNMEHLLAAATAVGELVDELPDLRVMITSQAPLRLAAELCLPLDALDDEAALTLIERVARRRTATFSVQGDSREALLDVVHLLDGLPLALELAAARLALLTPVQLRGRLRESPDVLSDDRADRPLRQRSLRATVEWTLSLLDSGTRALFVGMGAFAGPVELDDIEAVAGGDGSDVLQELPKLLDVALVRRVESGDGRVRFGLPEALRQFAAGLLDAAPDGRRWRRAHAIRQHDVVWAARHLLVTRPVYRAAAAADAETAAALRWARATADPLAPPLAAARGALLADNGHLREAFAVLEPLLEDPPDDPVIYAQALWAQTWALTATGRMKDATAAADQAVLVAPDPANRVMALTMRGLVRSFCGEHAAAIRDSEQATIIARELGPAMLCGVMMLESQARLFAGELDRAAERQAEAERIGAPADADFIWRRHTIYGDLAALTGRPRDALEHYADSLEEAQIRGNEMQVMFDLLGVANALGALEDYEEAVEVAGMAADQIAEMGGPEASNVHLLGQESIVAARTRLGPGFAAACDARGRAIPAGQRVTHACELARARTLVASAEGV
jgi:predicted ATPase